MLPTSGLFSDRASALRRRVVMWIVVGAMLSAAGALLTTIVAWTLDLLPTVSKPVSELQVVSRQ